MRRFCWREARSPHFVTGPVETSHAQIVGTREWPDGRREHVVDTNGLAPFFRAASLGAKENVQICLLLSPHYFPNWALKKWPHLAGCAGGFFKCCVHDEHAQGVIEKYLRTVIPLVRGNPALHSICLSNEPEQGHFRPDCALRKRWPGWLERRHGTVSALNAKWGDEK